MALRKSWPFTKPLPALPQRSASRHIPLLPSEVIARIIFHVTHIPTLKSCALVSSAFHRPSEKVLLSAVHIRLTSQEKNPYRAFLALITNTSPHIAHIVMSLNLSDFYLQDTSSTWLAYDSLVLPHILACLPNITYLGINAHNGISAATRMALSAYTFTPLLRCLSVRGLSLDLKDVFARCHSLEDTRLSSVEITPLHHDRDSSDDSLSSDELDITELLKPSPHGHTPPAALIHYHASIRQLSLQLTPSMGPEFVDELLHASVWKSFAHLEMLDVDLIQFPYPAAVQRLIAATSRCTSHLRLHVYHPCAPEFYILPTVPRVSYRYNILPRTGTPSFVDMFKPFSRLHRLSGSGSRRQPPNHPPNRWRGISDLRLEVEMGDAFSLFERENWEWAWLDEVMGAVRRKVTFAVIIAIPGETEEGLRADMEGRMKQCLPRAHERGVLRVAAQFRSLD